MSTPPSPPAEQQAHTEHAEHGEQRAHAFAREHGLAPRVYAPVRATALIALRLWFRIRVSGPEQIPAEGPAIIAPNHKNFLDPFFVGIATRRHVHYMTKIELFKGPLAWLLPRLGAFPVRRGEADAEALETARALLAAGELVVIFPEGTRVEQPDVLGSPHHGAGRLALETGAPIVPAAITGTSHLWRGALPQLRRVQLAFLPPVRPQGSLGADAGAQLIDELVWPAVQEEYGRLSARPGLITAGLAAVGIGGGLLARRRLGRRSQRPLLGKATPRRRRLLGNVEPRRPRLVRKVEPRRLRRRKARARLRARASSLRPRRRRRSSRQ